jgi:hypothetical protein
VPGDDMVPTVITFMLGITLVVAGVWDVYAFLQLTPQDTVSYVAWRLTQQFPPLVLMLGMILGHILWPLHIKDALQNRPSGINKGP